MIHGHIDHLDVAISREDFRNVILSDIFGKFLDNNLFCCLLLFARFGWQELWSSTFEL